MTPFDKGRRGEKRVEDIITVRVDEANNHHATRDTTGKEHPLIVDPRYQRGLDQRKVEEIRSDWDPIAADHVVLSLRKNGDLAIVNGQHLIVAALLEGETVLLAEVYTGLTVPREADIRLKKNNARPDTALEKFHARLAKEEETPGVATAIVALLGAFETHINKSPSKYEGINCVGVVERLYGRDDGVILRRTMKATKEAFGKLAGDPVTGAPLEGLAWFLTVHYGEYKWPKLIDQMRKNGVADLNYIARGFKRVMGGADWINYYRALVEVYNKSVRKSEAKLEMKTTRWTKEVPSGSFGRTGEELHQKQQAA